MNFSRLMFFETDDYGTVVQSLINDKTDFPADNGKLESLIHQLEKLDEKLDKNDGAHVISI